MGSILQQRQAKLLVMAIHECPWHQKLPVRTCIRERAGHVCVSSWVFQILTRYPFCVSCAVVDAAEWENGRMGTFEEGDEIDAALSPDDCEEGADGAEGEDGGDDGSDCDTDSDGEAEDVGEMEG